MLKILVVDDDEGILDLYKDLFDLWGYETVCCSTAKQTIDSCWSNNIDVAILDIMLPDMNGFELSKEIRKTGTYCPVIFWTGHNVGLNYIKSKQTSNIIVLNKPVPNTELRKIIKSQTLSHRHRTVLKAIAELEINYSGTKRFILLADTIYIGRAKTNDIRIPSPKISATHMMLIRMFEDEVSFYRVIDGEIGGKSSTNGVFVNGRRIPSLDYRDLVNGDLIEIPDVQMTYRLIDLPSDHNRVQTQV